MPQSKQEKRKTAIGLYRSAIALHTSFIGPTVREEKQALHRKRIQHLEQHIRNTEAKLEIGA